MAYNQWKLSGFPEAGFRKSLGALYDWFNQRDAHETTAGMSLEPVADAATSGASAITLTLAAYRTNITTGGTAGNENVNALPSGEYIGQRKLIYLATRTDASDVVVIATSNISRLLLSGETPGAVATLNLDAADEYAMLEWSGAEWNILYSNGTIA